MESGARRDPMSTVLAASRSHTKDMAFGEVGAVGILGAKAAGVAEPVGNTIAHEHIGGDAFALVIDRPVDMISW